MFVFHVTIFFLILNKPFPQMSGDIFGLCKVDKMDETKIFVKNNFYIE